MTPLANAGSGESVYLYELDGSPSPLAATFKQLPR